MEDRNSINIEEMLKIVQMFNQLQNTSEPEADTMETKKIIQEAVEKKRKIDAKFFDDNVLSADMRMLKSAIPFMEYKQQKFLGVFIKFIEMQKIIEMYSGVAANVKSQQSDWRQGMLKAMRPHLDEEKRDMVDVLINLMGITEVRDKIYGRVKKNGGL